MLSRALSLATALLLIGFSASLVQAQNLEAGKTPSQIFANTCTACHKGARGLLKTVAPGSLPGFLRQHYTTSSDMASVLSAYIISNGAADSRYGGGGLTKQGQESRTAPKPEQAETPSLSRRQRPAAQDAAKPDPNESPLFRRPRPAAQDAARPDADSALPPADAGGRRGRNAKRPPRLDADEARPAADGEPVVAPRQKLGRRGKPGRDEQPKLDMSDEPKGESAGTEPGKGNSGSSDAGKSGPKPDAAKPEPQRPEVAKPADDVKPEPARPEQARSEPALRADPVPAVTPAPKAPETAEPRQTVAPTQPTAPATASAPTPAPAAAAERPAPPPAIEARQPARPSPPETPGGPPAPPISQ